MGSRNAQRRGRVVAVAVTACTLTAVRARDRARVRAREQAQAAARRMTCLERVTERLAGAATPADVGAVAVAAGAAAFEADAALAYRLGADGSLHRLAQAGAGGGPGDDHGAPVVLEAVRTGERIVLETPAEVTAAGFADVPWGALLAVPLVHRERTLGGVAFAFRDGRALCADDRALAATIGAQCAQALDRARLLAAEGGARARGLRVQAVTAALATALTPREVAEVVIRDALGARIGAVAVLRAGGRELELLASSSAAGGPRRFQRFDVDAPLVLAEAVRVRAPVVVETAGAEARRFPLLGELGDEAAAVAAVPLAGGDDVLGTFVVVVDDREALDAETLAALRTVGQLAGQALERARLYAAERDARERIGRLQGLTAALSGCVTPAEVRRAIVSESVAAAGARAGGIVGLCEDGAPPAAAAGLRGGEPRWLRTPDEVRAAAAPGAGREVPPAGAEAWVPLVAGRGRADAALVLTFAHPREFPPGERAFLQAVGRQGAIALERARLYQAEHEVASRLQRSLLGPPPPPLENAHVAARYLPGLEDLDVGGDWHDVIALGDSCVGLAVGDVVGRGLPAATAMGKLRSALTALAPACAGPHELLERLDAFAQRIEGADMATVAYAVADPAAGTLRYACAGHPPPLLVPPGGEARFLMAGRSMPLGSVQDGARSEAVAALAPGALLLLYSDGLVERRRESVADGLERLRVEAGARAGLDVEAFCDALVAALVDTEGQHDDVALLCLRADPAPPAGRVVSDLAPGAVARGAAG